MFSDQKGLPIAIDSDKMAYRLPKHHKFDDVAKRHLPFDHDSNSTQSDKEKEQADLQQRKTERFNALVEI